MRKTRRKGGGWDTTKTLLLVSLLRGGRHTSARVARLESAGIYETTNGSESEPSQSSTDTMPPSIPYGPAKMACNCGLS